MKLAVVISTYDRKNKSSRDILTKLISMLRKQTYKNFKIYMIGDDYTNRAKFEELATSLDFCEV